MIASASAATARILRDQLDLTVASPKALAPKGEHVLTGWIREHLSVAVHPFPVDPLGDLEHRVLARLDPPLNLDGMPASGIRLRLAELRRALSLPPTTRIAATIGGGPDGYFSVEGNGTRLTWRGPPAAAPEGREQVEVLHPSGAAWDEFWQTLGRLDVWSWEDRYDTPGVLDGTHWSF